MNIDNLSVIIASNLINISKDWVKQINEYSKEGINVIISIPPNSILAEAYKIGFSENIKLFKSEKIGQVRQRQFGYKFCDTEFIIQMDDDIQFDIDSIKLLLSNFERLPKKSCLAPFLKRKIKRNKNSNFLIKLKNILLYSEINPQEGKIAKSSFPISLNKFNNQLKMDFKEVDWLPGGIFIIRSEDLIKDDYFKFKGKAYCEDLIHSFLLKDKGLKLYLSSKLNFFTPEESYRDLNINDFINFLFNDFIIRNYYRKMINNKFIPLLFAYFYLLVSFIGSKLKKIFLYDEFH